MPFVRFLLPIAEKLTFRSDLRMVSHLHADVEHLPSVVARISAYFLEGRLKIGCVTHIIVKIKFSATV